MGWDKKIWALTMQLSPQCGVFSRNAMERKSLSPIFLVGSGWRGGEGCGYKCHSMQFVSRMALLCNKRQLF